MKLQYQFEEADGHLIVTLTGQWHLPDLIAMVDDIVKECKQRGLHLVLVESNKAKGPIPELDRFRVGEYIAKVCQGISIVSIMQAQYINKFGENAAVNRGADFLVTSDREEAQNWLLQRKTIPDSTS